MFGKIKAIYDRLPKEVKVFVEYILPSAIITSLVDYLAGLEINNIYVVTVINLILIFLRELKPRFQRLKS